MTRRKILITGATSGLGLAITHKALARGHVVCATGRDLTQGEKLKAQGAKFISADLVKQPDRIPELVKNKDSIIHAAALSSSWGRFDAFYQSNVAMTENLLSAAKSAGCSRFILISSPSIFACYKDQLNIRHNNSPSKTALNHYAKTKLAAESKVLTHNGQMATCARRPRALVGPEDRIILPRLKEIASRKHILLPRGGSALIELTDIRDAAEAVLLAEENARSIAGQAINISGGQPYTVRDISQQLAESLQQKPKFINVPTWIAQFFASTFETYGLIAKRKTEPSLTRYTLATMGYSQTFDLSAADQLIGYKPKHDALHTLLTEAVKCSSQGEAL